MASGANPQTDAEGLFKAILKSGLLSRDDLQALLRTLSREQRDNLQFVADHLVQSGKLSSFQVQKLRKGVTGGLVVGPYHVVSPIGKGGMGTVYLARDTRTGFMVALKILSPKKAREEERMLARFQREMDISQRVSHPHLVRTYEIGEYTGVYYIAMEYIPGQTLYRHVQSRGPLKVQQAAQLFAEVAAGLDHAHGQGLIHRDLKPSNIMITPRGHAKVLDLGLALIEGEVGQVEIIGGRGYIVGSMDYIAPEQTMDAAQVDVRADVYGMACTMFFALAGRPPFPGGTSREKIQRQRKEQPPNIRDLNPQVPEEFAAILHKMMAKKPAERYPSARMVQQVLERWAAGHTVVSAEPEESAYQKAVRDLQTQPVESELLNEPILVSQSQDSFFHALWRRGERWLADWLDIDESATPYMLILLGFLAVWALLLLVLGLILFWS